MKKRFVYMAITSSMLVLGLMIMGCSTTGTVRHSFPDGEYHNYSQGGIVFDSASRTWEAGRMGYKGSFDFDETTSRVNLTAEQKLNGLRWTDIDPIDNFTDGQVTESFIRLGNFQFYHIIEEED
jgi:hypothetical protein